MRQPPQIRETKKCSVCGGLFRPRQRNQHACGNCRGRTQHNEPKWKVTRVVDGNTGGYAFSVSIGGEAPLGGYFIKSLTGYVRFPKKLVISVLQRRRLQKPLRKQVAQIVNAGDPRYHGTQTAHTSKQPEPAQPKPRCVPCNTECERVYSTIRDFDGGHPVWSLQEPNGLGMTCWRLRCPRCLYVFVNGAEDRKAGRLKMPEDQD